MNLAMKKKKDSQRNVIKIPLFIWRENVAWHFHEGNNSKILAINLFNLFGTFNRSLAIGWMLFVYFPSSQPCALEGTKIILPSNTF